MAKPKKDAQSILERLVVGQPPPPRLAAEALVGFEAVMGEWKRDLDDYIAGGGSLLRIISGPVGSGKTHLARALQAYAAERGFLVCQVDAQAQHTDDDLALYGAFCTGLTHPKAFLNEEIGTGLLSVLSDVADRMTEVEVHAMLRPVDLPIVGLRDGLTALVSAIRARSSTSPDSYSDTDEVDALAALISGQPVDGTRSLAKLRRVYQGPLLRKLPRTPGKRDARLWLESLLRTFRPLGFLGVVLVLDEHDSVTHRVLDRHIVQLRRKLDRLTEGHLPGVFAVYFVLDTFGARVEENHAALGQRIRPLLHGHVPRRVMADLADLRGMDGVEFLQKLGERLYRFLDDGRMPADVEELRDRYAAEYVTLGLTDTRSFVKRFLNELLDR